jgi:hypothetical protein
MKTKEETISAKPNDNKIQRPTSHPWKKNPAVNRTSGELRAIERTYDGRLPDPRF